MSGYWVVIGPKDVHVKDNYHDKELNAVKSAQYYADRYPGRRFMVAQIVRCFVLPTGVQEINVYYKGEE